MASCSAVVKKLFSQLLLLVGALFATTSFANTSLVTTQSIDDVQAAAEEFVRSRLPASHAKQFVTAAKLDSRLRVGSCAQPLETFEQSATNLGERVTVGVRCSAANSWTLYVPVLVEVEIPVLVLRRALARRARVAMIDVEPQTRRVPGTAATFLQDTASLQGHRLKRSLPAGTALTVEMLVPDLVVRRGQQVTLIAAIGHVEIRAQGHALTEGGVADRVRVQNTSSLKVVEGVVGSDGAVRVGI
jgi:flagellar basal body P-ring formation protein FlgA